MNGPDWGDTAEGRMYQALIAEKARADREHRMKWMRRRVIARDILKWIWVTIVYFVIAALIIIGASAVAALVTVISHGMVCAYPVATVCGP